MPSKRILLLTFMTVLFLILCGTAAASDTINLSADNTGVSNTYWSYDSVTNTYTILDNVSVTSTTQVTGVTAPINFVNTYGKTITWNADVTGSTTGSLIEMTSTGGKFDMIGGQIKQEKGGSNALGIRFFDQVVLRNDAKVIAIGDYVIAISADLSDIYVNDNAQVRTTGNGTIAILTADNDIYVNDNAQISADGAGFNTAIHNTMGDVKINGGTISITGQSSIAILC